MADEKTHKDRMKILVYGAGVLGSLYAARLKRSGQEVTILARGQRAAEIREHGIVLEDVTTGQRTATPINVEERLAPDDAYDLVVVLMRRTQISAVLPVLAANHHTPNILFLCNNASGPDEMSNSLGRERVLLGFPGAGGVREEHVVRYIVVSARNQATTFGELDGRTTPRLKQIAHAFKGAGFPVETSRNMDAWLKTHVAKVSPVANALYMAGGDNHLLAGRRDALVLMVRAMREGFQVLRVLNIPILPSRLKIVEWLPEPMVILLMRLMVNSKEAEITMAGHANAARDEMKQLADEFKALARAASIATPAMDRLYAYI
jgi:2-dehydropantoate 2-reductase